MFFSVSTNLSLDKIRSTGVAVVLLKCWLQFMLSYDQFWLYHFPKMSQVLIGEDKFLSAKEFWLFLHTSFKQKDYDLCLNLQKPLVLRSIQTLFPFTTPICNLSLHCVVCCFINGVLMLLCRSWCTLVRLKRGYFATSIDSKCFKVRVSFWIIITSIFEVSLITDSIFLCLFRTRELIYL